MRTNEAVIRSSFIERISPTLILAIAGVFGLLVGLGLILGIFSINFSGLDFAGRCIAVITSIFGSATLTYIFVILPAGFKADGALVAYLESQIDALEQLLLESEERLLDIEGRMIDRLHSMGTADVNSLYLARRVSEALKVRLKKVNTLCSKRFSSKAPVIRHTLEADLEIKGGTLHAVLGAEPVESLAFEYWEPTLTALINSIELSLKKAA